MTRRNDKPEWRSISTNGVLLWCHRTNRQYVSVDGVWKIYHDRVLSLDPYYEIYDPDYVEEMPVWSPLVIAAL